MQLRSEVHPQVSHVLHDQGIDARGEQLAGLSLGLLQFVVEQQRVEGRMHPYAEAVSVLRHAGDLLRAVAGGLPRPELRAPDVEGVGAAIHGGDGRSIVFGRSEQFDGRHGDQPIFRQK